MQRADVVPTRPVCFACVQIRCEEVPRNPGRLHVSRPELLAFAALQHGPNEGRAMMTRMGFRLLALVAIAASAIQLAGDASMRAAAEALLAGGA